MVEKFDFFLHEFILFKIKPSDFTDKVSRRAKRLRINQRLRKVLQPKNAIMVLHEMKTGVQFVFPESQSVLPSSLFLAHAEVNFYF